MKSHQNIKKQHGAALVVGLILLVVITVLAVSGMNTATTELAMARNHQYYENAFQAAESGLEQVLALGQFNTTTNANLTHSITTNESVETEIVYESMTIVPDKGFSLGVGSGVAAYHFNAIATAKSERLPGGETDRDSSAVHTQSFYIVGPESPAL